MVKNTQCAQIIDLLDEVDFWVRNIDSQPPDLSGCKPLRAGFIPILFVN